MALQFLTKPRWDYCSKKVWKQQTSACIWCDNQLKRFTTFRNLQKVECHIFLFLISLVVFDLDLFRCDTKLLFIILPPVSALQQFMYIHCQILQVLTVKAVISDQAHLFFNGCKIAPGNASAMIEYKSLANFWFKVEMVIRLSCEFFSGYLELNLKPLVA